MPSESRVFWHTTHSLSSAITMRANSRTLIGRRFLVYTALVKRAIATPMSGDFFTHPAASSSAKSPIRLMAASYAESDISGTRSSLVSMRGRELAAVRTHPERTLAVDASSASTLAVVRQGRHDRLHPFVQ